jgi:hypothetical protein
MIQKFLRLQDYLEIHDRDADRMAAQSGLAMYSTDDELKHVNRHGHAVRSLADDAFGWVMNSVMSTTVSTPGSITFEYDRVELREPGAAASTSHTRFYNSSVGIDPSEDGSVRIDVSNVSVDDDANAKLFLAASDAPDGSGLNGNDHLIAEVRGDGTVVTSTSEGGTQSQSTLSKDNAYVNSLNYVEVRWDGSSLTVETSDGSTVDTVSESGNYPSGENLHLAVKAEDQDGSNQRNADYDVERVKRT